MTFSLFSTALGGFYLFSGPDIFGLQMLFAYWGLTSVLLFWAAMIKATRDWGGAQSQGFAFGFLDGGRGLIASIFASAALFVFALILDSQSEDILTQKQALDSVILLYSISTLMAALLIWMVIPEYQSPQENIKKMIPENIIEVANNSRVWLQGGIIVAAYCGFKSLDNYGVYAVQVLKMSQVESVELTTIASYARPVAAVIAGLIADKWQASKLIMLLFFIAALTFLLQNFIKIDSVAMLLIFANLAVTFAAVYALRGIYFTLLEESKLKKYLTGTAVGLVSVLGYTPDIFFSPLTGRILDANPGFLGFQNYFLLLAAISIAGLVFAFLLTKRTSTKNKIET